MLRVGILVNPIAGIGGAAGHKGSDSDWKADLEAGFLPHAPERAKRFVAAVEAVGGAVDWQTLPGALGVDGLPVVEDTRLPTKALGETTPDDSVTGAQALMEAGVDLLCFVGGDGTATDMAKAVGTRVPCLGVPAGVKITSPVFTHDVEEAAWLVANLGERFETVERDVTDLDEPAYRAGRIETHLTGQLCVPLSPAVQGGKMATTVDTPLEPLVEQVLRDWDRGAVWLVGAGSVCRAIKEKFWGRPTLLGVDAIDGDRIVATDLDGPAVEALVADAQAGDRPVRVLLSTIGGQGVLLGRGTQVLTPKALRAIGWDGVHVAAPPEKLLGLRGLWVDSGDPEWDAQAPRHMRVVTGWNETRMVRVLHGTDLR